MTVQIFKDVEEALAREVRRISFHDNRTVEKKVLQHTFDPFTGEVVELNIEPSFYDSSTEANHIQFPHFFIRLMKVREDRFSGRETQYWGQQTCSKYEAGTAQNRQKAWEILLYVQDGVIPISGIIQTQTLQIRKAAPGNLLRIQTGPNAGTYTIAAVTPGAPHVITLNSVILNTLPGLAFNSSTRTVTILDSVDMSAIRVGDTFVDSINQSFVISSINADNLEVVLEGTLAPNLAIGSKIERLGAILQPEAGPVTFLVMDQNKPVTKNDVQVEPRTVYSDFAIPLDLFYLVRIDSKERESHIQVLNRVWEEFNPPRSGLPVVVRTKASAEQLLAAAIPVGGSSVIVVKDSTNFNINDDVFVFDNLKPTKSTTGSFEAPFKAKVVDKLSGNQLKLSETVPDTYTMDNETKVVSNADFQVIPLHFVDHLTKDIEGSQYWVHEFSFMAQTWIDRLGEGRDVSGVILDPQITTEIV